MPNELTTIQALREGLKHFEDLDDCAQEAVADYFACPSAEDCQFDGVDTAPCAACKVRWLLSKWEG